MACKIIFIPLMNGFKIIFIPLINGLQNNFHLEIEIEIEIEIFIEHTIIKKKYKRCTSLVKQKAYTASSRRIHSA